MTYKDLDEITAAYDAGLETGKTPGEAVGWMTPHSQLANFLALARVEGLAAGARVLDIGCGLGALKDFFDSTGLTVDYTGIDVSEKMVAGARRRHPNARFEQRDILAQPLEERFDFVFCSGTLNLLLPDHPNFVGRMVQAMWAAAERALSFNLLSAHSFARTPALQRTPARFYYAWPDKVLRFCLNLSPLVTLDHGSRAASFTVHVYRGNPDAGARYLQQAPVGRVYDERAIAALGYLTELGLVREAEALLETLEPSIDRELQLGGLMAARGDLAGAEAAYIRARNLDARNSWTHLHLGILAMRQGRLDDAALHVGRALQFAPSNSSAAEVMIAIEVRRGRDAAAAKLAATLPAGATREQLLGLTAANAEIAEAHFRAALEQAPRMLEAMVQLAVLLERRGATAEAAAYYQRALEIQPGDPTLTDRLARLATHSG